MSMVSRSSAITGGWKPVWLIACAVAAMTRPAMAHDAEAVARLGSLSVEELADLEITSVSKRPEKLSAAPAAVFVIGADDIRRSGVSSLPEALRLAPNLQVGRVDARDYSISSRGLNSFEVTNKLLVLIDGRSVYTPLSGGVDWDAQTVMLADLDRIEVISGPGGTLWGANAVNGVINVVSRSAFDTQGGLVDVSAGSRDSNLALRYGGALGAAGAYRVYVQAMQRGPTERTTALRMPSDRWRGVQAGFRTDWKVGAGSLTLQGDVYDDDLGALFTPGEYIRGGNVMGRWDRTLADGSTLGVQAYHDLTRRRARGVYNELSTYDVEARHGRSIGRHSLVLGAGYRSTKDDFRNLLNAFVLDPPRERISLGNVFAQDDIRLGDRLTLTLGLKLEDSNFSGLEYLPNARLAWRPAENQLLWASVARAVRTPSRIERDLVFPGLLVKGGFDTEKLVAYEAGYRGQPWARTSISISAYYNVYDDIRTTQPTPRTVVPITLSNGAEGRTYGIDAWGDVDLTEHWRLGVGISTLQKDFKLKPGRADLVALKTGGNDPDVQVTLRSQMILTDRIDLDVRVRGVDDLPAPRVPAYVEADVRLGWRVTDAVELSLSGFNLLEDSHLETAEPRSTQVPRSVQAGLRWRY